MAVYEIDYLFQVSVYFDRDFARREVAAGYETGSNLNHCVKTRFFSQDEWHDGSLRLVPAQTKGKIASRSRIDRTELWATGAEVGVSYSYPKTVIFVLQGVRLYCGGISFLISSIIPSKL